MPKTATKTDSFKSPASTNNAAKDGMLSIFKGPTPPKFQVRRNGGGGGGGTALCKFVGVVTGVRDDKVTGRSGQSIPKKRLNIEGVVPIGNNAQDIVQPGIPGETVLFPSLPIDDPSAAEDSNGFKVKKRELQVSSMQSVASLNSVSISFYMEGKDGLTAAASATVGMEVEVSGVCAHPVGSSMFVNASKITPAGSAPPPYEVAKSVMAYCERPEMQKQAAFNCSRTADGFFETTLFNPAQEVQAKACQTMWKTVIEGTADRISVMAKGKPEAMATELDAHQHRIRAINPETLADGSQTLWLRSQYDADVAPLVLKGCAPWNQTPPLVQMLSSGKATAAHLPSTFTIPKVTDVSVQGGGVTVEITVAYCFDRDAAVEALEESKHNPLLLSQGPAACISLSLRDLASKIGTWKKDRVVMAAKQLLPYADFAVFAKVSNLEKGATASIKSDFPNGGIFVDMVTSIRKTSIIVSESFIKKHMCDGNTQFVPDEDASEELTPLDAAIKKPFLETHRYQELTSAGFKFASLQGKVPAGMSLEYRVIYDGVAANLESSQEETQSTEAGENHLETMASAAEVTLRDMLCISAVVYAVVV
tara:strand:+ start:2686 stop:4461 length:1776 start_codon:yes stop_codon:yes gene_type:complete